MQAHMYYAPCIHVVMLCHARQGRWVAGYLFIIVYLEGGFSGEVRTPLRMVDLLSWCSVLYSRYLDDSRMYESSKG